MSHVSTTNKGTKVMEGLLLSQYKSSPNLIAYITAYVEEMDELFEAIENVYFGRLFDDAEGIWLDIIGRLMGQSRNVDVTRSYFGFQGATGAVKMADQDLNPDDGGIFRSASDGGFAVNPMDDATYRRALECKSILMSSQTPNINLAYRCIAALLGRVPAMFSLVETSKGKVDLTLATSNTNADEIVLINYMSKYYMQSGVELTIILL